MQDVTTTTITNIIMLDKLARAVLGSATSGASVGGYGSTIHIINDTPDNIQKAQAILDALNTMPVSCDLNTIYADGVQLSTIEANSNAANTNWVITTSANVTYAEGVADNQLIFGTDDVGDYAVCFYNPVTYASGAITITAITE